MENTALYRPSPIVSANLNRNDFAVSLLNEGLRTGLTSGEQVGFFQQQLMLLMRKSIERYTRGQSSSIRTSIAQNILLSNLYTIDAALLAFANPEDALTALMNESVQTLWEKGQQCIKDGLTTAKALYQQVKETRLPVQIIAYNSTIDDAFDSFFKDYDVLFGAHDTMAGIDYPLAHDDQSLRGIFYIKQYLEKLSFENEFCGLFPPMEATALMQNYGRLYRSNYKDLLINVFELTLRNALCCILIGKPAVRLILSSTDCTLLQERLRTLNRMQLSALMDEAIFRLSDELTLLNLNGIAYIHSCKGAFVASLYAALEQDTLQSFVITQDDAKLQPAMVFREGKKMDDKSFRIVYNRVAKAEDAAEKAQIIHSQLHSLTDIVDILLSGCINGAESVALYRLLSDLELSLLAERAFFEDLRELGGDFALVDLLTRIGKTEVDYKVALLGYLMSLGEERLKAIEAGIRMHALSSDLA